MDLSHRFHCKVDVSVGSSVGGFAGSNDASVSVVLIDLFSLNSTAVSDSMKPKLVVD